MARTVLLTPEKTREELARFEREHGMSSADFYEKFAAGHTEHSADLLHWAWMYEVAVRSGALATVTRA